LNIPLKALLGNDFFIFSVQFILVSLPYIAPLGQLREQWVSAEKKVIKLGVWYLFNLFKKVQPFCSPGSEDFVIIP